jgi:outer membrane cobalamin receptor
MSALEVLASRAGEKTPVAHTTVEKADMEFRLGSQDLPMALNLTPSVYATQQGGGAGDARINVRGFNQRNIAVMINGVPQNDMENGWVYWSNWDGVADASHSIQMQRGLSAVNLAAPSIGGTMNIITDPTAHSKGGRYKQEVGAGGFLKSTLNYNSGLIGDKPHMILKHLVMMVSLKMSEDSLIRTGHQLIRHIQVNNTIICMVLKQ